MKFIKKGWLWIPKTTRLYIKVIALLLFASSISFGVGTFYPNFVIADKMQQDTEDQMIHEWKQFGFLQPSIEYTTNPEFIIAVGRCVDFLNLSQPHNARVHKHIIVAMAVLETGYGKSRFATEGNNLFGIRTWDPKVPQLKPKALPDAEFGVKMYNTKCDSVKDMVAIINRHPAYEEFRAERQLQINTGKLDLDKQIDLLHKWSTNPDYTKLVKIKGLQVADILAKELAN
jgi:Bax protein